MKSIRQNQLDSRQITYIARVLEHIQNHPLNSCFRTHGHKDRGLESYPIESYFSCSCITPLFYYPKLQLRHRNTFSTLKTMFTKSGTSITAIAVAIATRSTLMVGTAHAEQSITNCENIIFSINGPEKTLINQEYTFTVNGYELSYQSGQNSTGQQDETETVLATGSYKFLLGDEASIQYDIVANNKAINRFYEDQLLYNFKQSGKYQIQATIRHPQCAYKITKDINTFTTLYTRVGNEPTNTIKSLVANIEQKDIGFGRITISKQENLSQSIKDNQQIIKDSEAIIIDYNNYNDIFKAIQNIIQEDETQRDIIIVSSTAKQITKKILAPVLKESHLTKIYLLSEAELENVMVELSIQQTPSYKQFLISYE